MQKYPFHFFQTQPDKTLYSRGLSPPRTGPLYRKCKKRTNLVLAKQAESTQATADRLCSYSEHRIYGYTVVVEILQI